LSGGIGGGKSIYVFLLSWIGSGPGVLKTFRIWDVAEAPRPRRLLSSWFLDVFSSVGFSLLFCYMFTKRRPGSAMSIPCSSPFPLSFRSLFVAVHVFIRLRMPILFIRLRMPILFG
jgi:hypothetical protein